MASWYHSPFFLAQQAGYYKDVGLDVSIGDGQGSATTGEVVSKGSDTFGLMALTTVIQSVQKGEHLVCIGGYIQRPPDGVIALAGSGIKSMSDLAGKTWGETPGSAPEALFPAIASKAGLDLSSVKKVSVPASAVVSALVTGKVDFVTKWIPTNVPLIEAAGKSVVTIPYSNYIDANIQCIVATPATVANDPALVKAFLAASARGFDAAMKDHAAAVDAMIAERPSLSGQKSILVAQMQDLSTYLHTTASAGKPLFWMAPSDMQSMISISKTYLGLTGSPDAATLYTNKFVPSS